MFTTQDLPATMRFDPAAPHVCGHPACGIGAAQSGQGQNTPHGVPSSV